MFPEYRELITKLKTEGHTRFLSLFEKHNDLDHKVEELIGRNAPDDEVNAVKKEKLAVKDELHQLLRQEAEKA